MSKIISIILSIVLLLTVVSTAFVNPVLAAQTLDDTNTAVLPLFVDENGSEINLPYTSEYIPNSVFTGNELSLSKNTSNLPLQTLFTFNADGTKHTAVKIEGAQGKGMLLYVEMPESLNDAAVRLSMTFFITDGQTGLKNQERYEYGSTSWYYLGEDDTKWTSKNIERYGIPLTGGFKGYVYVPFKSIKTGATDLPETPENEASNSTDKINWGIDSADIITGVEFQTANGYSAYEGSMNADSKITVSAPIIITGEFDSNTPDTRKIVAGGEELYLFAKHEPYTGTAVHTALGTPDIGSQLNGEYYAGTDATVTMTEIAGINPLINAPSYQFSKFVKNGMTLKSSTGTQDNDISCGVVFYVETTLSLPEFAIQFGIYVDGTYKTAQTSPMYGNLFYLQEGATSWKGTGDVNTGLGDTTYRRRIRSTDGFKGYIYQPYTGSASTPELGTGNYNNAKICIYPNDTDGSGNPLWLDKNGNEAVVKISHPMVVTSFNKDSAVVTVDGGALVDPFTNEVVVQEDYFAPDKFYGNSALINNVSNANILSLQLGSDPTRVANGITYKDDGNGTGEFVVWREDKGHTLTLAENDTVFKQPLLRIKSTATQAAKGFEVASIRFAEMKASDYSGAMLYIRNDSNTDVNFSIVVANSYILEPTIPFLSLSDGKWQWSALNKVKDTTYTYCLPAGKGGFMYLSNAYLKNTTSCNTISIRTAADTLPDTYYQNERNIVISAPLFVKNFSKNNAGMAFVNGSTVAQDLISGNFTCPNDYNGDLAVNLLDLVKGKAKQADITEFRNSYLSVYAK